MSSRRFEDIMQALRFTDTPPPNYNDRFHDVRQMITEFNRHYEENYVPGWISCIDESMIDWLNKYCPGWMCVPRKPHPFGNEYHTICDGDLLQGAPIMFRAELVEGKDRPRKIVTMDSGFSVSKGIIAMKEKGVFGQALVKPRGKGWPVLVPGKYIDEYFATRPIGHCETLEQIVDGVKFFIHCQKEEKYVTKIMSCHGVLTPVEDHETSRDVTNADGSRSLVRFKYPEPISRHNRAKHWVDDTNNRRHDPIALSAVWRTKWWPNRQFTFLLEVAKANAANSRARARKENAEPQLVFRRALAQKMLTNNLDKNGTTVPQIGRPITRGSLERVKMDHELTKRPLNTGAWDDSTGTWAVARDTYQKTNCATFGCRNRCRTYCSCNKKVSMCRTCYNFHFADMNSTMQT
ncbi:hypothetical protein ACHAXS_004154 [Conticribra weissflogii]